jgi:hypothetical protein
LYRYTRVTSIMAHFNIAVDEAIFNHTPQDTFTYKCQEIRRLVGAAGPDLRRVRIWEDRVKHARWFEEFGAKEFAHLEQWEVILVEPSNDF